MPSRAKPAPLKALTFSRALAAWYRLSARSLPWRGSREPYQIWISEVMLQQTRVGAVIQHYHAFLDRFPTLVSLALATEEEALAAWSGLGYYRRARTMHEAAQLVVRAHGGELPRTAKELRALPGIGDYTAAAIASIAFGERVPVLDGNVERVLLRLMGKPEAGGTAARAALLRQAAELMPSATSEISAGDHNQAMMELGATVCLPSGPLCKECPVRKFCATRGEHATLAREKMRSREVAYLLHTRRQGPGTEVRLRKRPADAALMPGMWELPEAELGSVEGLPALLRVRHSITNTNYYVRVHAAERRRASFKDAASAASWEGESDWAETPDDAAMAAATADSSSGRRRQAKTGAAKEEWVDTRRLGGMALTGLARKVLQRLEIMGLPSLAGRGGTAEVAAEADGAAGGSAKKSDPRFQRAW